jgi:lipopolysaccharide/colanic/teichoic acid biosynthesis glycosyltransferase
VSAPGPYRGKRVLDLVVAGLCAPPAAVLGVLCAAAIRATSPGPVFFRQLRVGRDEEQFEMVKFRTMVHAPQGNPLLPDPDRITTVGAWLRRLSLDELPQLLNVFRGQMSIVGPRPTLAYQVERYDSRQRLRLAVRPGMTGLAQVRGRNSISWPERIEIDLEYVQRQSPWLDLRILTQTLGAVLGGVGVHGHSADDPLGRL